MRVFRYIFSFFAIAALPLASRAQAAEASLYEQYQLEIVVGVAAVVCVLALMALITVLVALRAILRDKQGATETEEELIDVKEGEEGTGFWRRLWNRLNDSVPVSQEQSIMTSHEYDGIRELDNRLPPWWLYGFYVSIVFSVGYLLYFHVFDMGKLQAAEYEHEMAEARAEVEAYLASMDNLIDESNVTLTLEQDDLERGLEIFQSQCSACHGNEGQGGVGPNLTDQYWLHGGTLQDIFSTVKYGVPSKGMIAWQSQLTPKEMQQVSSYIYTLEGTEPPNPKEPQGELYERPEEKDPTEDAETKTTVEAGI